MKIDNIYLKNFKNDNKIYNNRLSEIKPIYRGWIHLKVTYCLLFTIVNLIFYLLYENIIYNRYNYSISNFNGNYNNDIVNHVIVNINNLKSLIYFLILKLFSYGSSSFLHRFPFKNKKLFELSLMNDLIAVSISIYGSNFIFIYNLQDFKTYQNNNIFFILIAIICVIKDNKSLFSKWDILRMFVTICHSMYVFLVIGNLVNYNILWKIICISYNLSFLIYGLKQIKIKPMYWHNKYIYGYHEDFHLILVLSDFLLIILGIKYLNNI